MYAQGTELKAKVDFSMKLEGRGRACLVKVGDSFTVTNPQYAQDKGIKIDRTKKALLNQGYMLAAEQIEQLFYVVQ